MRRLSAGQGRSRLTAADPARMAKRLTAATEGTGCAS